jgi:hypothetical protein
MFWRSCYCYGPAVVGFPDFIYPVMLLVALLSLGYLLLLTFHFPAVVSDDAFMLVLKKKTLFCQTLGLGLAGNFSVFNYRL